MQDAVSSFEELATGLDLSLVQAGEVQLLAL